MRTSQEPIKLLTPEQVAQQLGINKRTVYAYLKDGLFTFQEYSVIAHGERVRYRFYPGAIKSFLARNQKQPEKRVYNRRIVKNSRKKD